MSNYNYEIESLIDNVKEEHTYLSETKKEVIDGVKGNYPQLCTYESEWIYFDETGYFPGEPVEIEYQTLENVSQATVLNAIPQPYKQATVHGQTLINYNHGPIMGDSDFSIGTLWFEETSVNLVSGKQYFIKLFNHGNYFSKFYYASTERTSLIDNSYAIITATDINSKRLHIYVETSLPPDYPVSNIRAIICEYQNGMENWEIPYFEGMTSVQNPVLTIKGKNLFDINGQFITAGGNTYSINGDTLTTTGSWYIHQDVDLKPNTKYTLSYEKAESANGFTKMAIYTNNISTLIHYTTTNQLIFTTPSNYENISVVLYAKEGGSSNTVSYSKIQLEQGSQATTYEAFQSNVVSCQEDVKLHSFGASKDELNLITGEVIQRVQEVVLDGSESWRLLATNSNAYRTVFTIPRGEIPTASLLNCDKYSSSTKMLGDEISGYIYIGGSNLNVVEGPNMSLDTFKNNLNLNPIAIQYPLSAEVIKSVNLTPIRKPFEGTNYYTTSSDTLPPTLTLQVPVVSTGAQTLQDINE